jgi:hypothetical protein
MIYEIEQQIEELLLESDGEITDVVERLLEDKEKAEKWLHGVTRAYLNEVARLEGLSHEIARLNQLKADTAKRIERLKESAGRLTGGQKADLGYAKISFRASEALEIEQGFEEKIPDDYLVPKWYADKQKLKAALKAGAEVPHCKLVQRQNVIIK